MRRSIICYPISCVWIFITFLLLRKKTWTKRLRSSPKMIIVLTIGTTIIFAYGYGSLVAGLFSEDEPIPLGLYLTMNVLFSMIFSILGLILQKKGTQKSRLTLFIGINVIYLGIVVVISLKLNLSISYVVTLIIQMMIIVMYLQLSTRTISREESSIWLGSVSFSLFALELISWIDEKTCGLLF